MRPLKEVEDAHAVRQAAEQAELDGAQQPMAAPNTGAWLGAMLFGTLTGFTVGAFTFLGTSIAPALKDTALARFGLPFAVGTPVGWVVSAIIALRSRNLI
jgi:hypothetical protein